jgi:hypothetical protein
MLRVSQSKWMKAGTQTSRLQFEVEGGDRFLCIDGKRAYHLGFGGCQTCSFLFERLWGANQAVQIDATVSALRDGVNSLDDDVVRMIGSGLPEGEYFAILGESPVTMVKPGDANDYFIKEQIALWGENTFWCLPHDPRVPYFRAGDCDIGDSKHFFNFVAPMMPTQWLKMATIAEYKEALKTNAGGTAVALAILDVRGPADFNPDHPPNPQEHWCLTHYLIDGHHKLNAASETGKPLRLLSFISGVHGVCCRADIEKAVSLLQSLTHT